MVELLLYCWLLIKGTVALYRQAFVTKNKRIQIAEVNDVNTCTLRRPTGHASGT